jgi:hypothetical protein
MGPATLELGCSDFVGFCGLAEGRPARPCWPTLIKVPGVDGFPHSAPQLLSLEDAAVRIGCHLLCLCSNNKKPLNAWQLPGRVSRTI